MNKTIENLARGDIGATRIPMLTVLTDGIEVHDAVYSKADIQPEMVQDTIRTITDFDIIIEKSGIAKIGVVDN